MVDLVMPLLNGIDAAREIAKASRKTKTILLTMHIEDRYVIGALKAGVKGYILKTQTAPDLVRFDHGSRSTRAQVGRSFEDF